MRRPDIDPIKYATDLAKASEDFSWWLSEQLRFPMIPAESWERFCDQCRVMDSIMNEIRDYAERTFERDRRECDIGPHVM